MTLHPTCIKSSQLKATEDFFKTQNLSLEFYLQNKTKRNSEGTQKDNLL